VVSHLRLLCTLFLLSSAFPAFAQEPVILRYQFVKNCPTKLEVSSELTQNMKVAGSDIKSTYRQRLSFTWTAVDQDNESNWFVKQKIEAIKLDAEIGGSPAKTYDSPKEGVASTPLGEFFDKLVGSEYKLTISKEMKLIKVEGWDDFFKKRDPNPHMELLNKHINGVETLEEIPSLFLITLPINVVRVGDRWKQSRVIDLAPIGRILEDREYTYRGEGKDKLKRIDVLTLGEYAKPEPAVAAGLPFTIAEANLTYLDSGGVIKFDNRNGRVASAELTSHWRGTMTIAVGGQNTKVELAMTLKSTLKTSGPDLPAPEIAPEVVQPNPPSAVARYQPCPCRAHRLLHRFRRCR
jgi:hypothetical protein